jgi:predicted RNA polymerase sigma factor
MRVIVFVKATDDSERGVPPATDMLEAMGKFNEELVNAGVMLAADGLKASSHGKRVAFDGPGRTVIDGPFAELTLRVIGGLTTDEIARAFLSNEATIAQRIVRAKKTIGKAGFGFEAPRGAERAARLSSVLEVIYLIFNEGYAATAGDDPVRPSLCLEAQRLGRILAGLMPEDAEVFGLLALMEIQASRLPARIGPDGALVPLTEQNRARWDQLLIRRGLGALARAEALGGADGPYALQAALAACHARSRCPADTDWPRIAALYDQLRAVARSPVVDLNRAIAHSMAFGPQAGLRLVDEIADGDALRNYAPLPAARGRFPVSGRPTGRGPLRIRSCG